MPLDKGSVLRKLTGLIRNLIDDDVVLEIRGRQMSSLTSCDGQWSLKIDIPRGRYEFHFLCNVIWATSNSYAACPNDFGCFNNWIHVK
ncbi:hypothetical protein T05_2800 [Trichinella murrelli]|uniref:AMP-activated protein kinase glycogen-binding domain-containing protein n=1 Tax=Trichinella murrelli TaxID=144512 RepID=A0A0V0UIZ2_9BILA|nr:hypothetical protein T05_2800 [Trichinella murrelli]